MSATALVRIPRLTTLAVVLSAVAGALASLGVISLTGHDAATGPQEQSAFRMSVPAGWQSLTRRELAAFPSHPDAVVRRADRRGLVVVRRIAPLRVSSARLMHDLGRRLRARFPGFQVVGARFTQLRGGRAFAYTFTRDPRRTVQTIAFASVGGGMYEIEASVPDGASKAARDAGAIVASFGP